jgi:hypothetical protein
MSADIAHELQSTVDDRAVRSLRARLVLVIGPLTVLAGIGWAVLQPWRLTLLHPSGQGFWWLVSQPPLYVVAVGVIFRLAIARGLVEDMLAREREAGR